MRISLRTYATIIEYYPYPPTATYPNTTEKNTLIPQYRALLLYTQSLPYSTTQKALRYLCWCIDRLTLNACSTTQIYLYRYTVADYYYTDCHFCRTCSHMILSKYTCTYNQIDLYLQYDTFTKYTRIVLATKLQQTLPNATMRKYRRTTCTDISYIVLMP